MISFHFHYSRGGGRRRLRLRLRLSYEYAGLSQTEIIPCHVLRRGNHVQGRRLEETGFRNLVGLELHLIR